MLEKRDQQVSHDQSVLPKIVSPFLDELSGLCAQTPKSEVFLSLASIRNIDIDSFI